MNIILNSTPLISLAILEQLELLRKIFNNVIIPQAVYNEVIIKGKGKKGYDALLSIDWFSVECIENDEFKRSIMTQLDEGESEVICIAKEKGVPLVCIDEFAGRQYAKLLGLEVIGTLGILLIAKQKGYINELRPLLIKLIDNNRHIGALLYNQILVKSGEAEIL